VGDIFDSLFSVLPIVLAILWLVRRTTKSAEKRQRTKKPSRDAKSASAPSLRDRIEEKTRPEPAERAEKKLGSFAAKAFENFFGESVPRSEAEPPYEKMEDRKTEGPKPVKIKKAADPSTYRTLADSTNSYDVSLYNQRPETSLERISRLSPLAQGMIWSFILDEPPGMRDR
jgi:hypothetical protein